MKRIQHIFILAFLTLYIVACHKSDIDAGIEPSEVLSTANLRFEAQIGEVPTTKVVFDKDETGNLKSVWSADDAFSLYKIEEDGSLSYKTDFVIDDPSGAGTANASFCATQSVEMPQGQYLVKYPRRGLEEQEQTSIEGFEHLASTASMVHRFEFKGETSLQLYFEQEGSIMPIKMFALPSLGEGEEFIGLSFHDDANSATGTVATLLSTAIEDGAVINLPFTPAQIASGASRTLHVVLYTNLAKVYVQEYDSDFQFEKGQYYEKGITVNAANESDKYQYTSSNVASIPSGLDIWVLNDLELSKSVELQEAIKKIRAEDDDMAREICLLLSEARSVATSAFDAVAADPTPDGEDANKYSFAALGRLYMPLVETVENKAFKGVLLEEVHAPKLKTIGNEGFGTSPKMRVFSAPALEELGNYALKKICADRLYFPNLKKAGTGALSLSDALNEAWLEMGSSGEITLFGGQATSGNMVNGITAASGELAYSNINFISENSIDENGMKLDNFSPKVTFSLGIPTIEKEGVEVGVPYYASITFKTLNGRTMYVPEGTMPIDYDDYTKIYFDEEYPADLSGESLVSAIETIVKTINADAAKPTMIIFEKEEYDLAMAELDLTKPVLLSGPIPSEELNLETVGHIKTTTSFKNPGFIDVTTNNIGFANFFLNDDGDLSTYGMVRLNNDVVGFLLFNVHVKGSSVQILGRNGAGVEMQNVTFENFQGAGYTCNRKQVRDVMPKCSFKNCKFFTNRNYYDTRGISFDSGNTEYPVIWDLQETLIEGCQFIRTGVGFSKGENAIIRNNYFENNSLSMDMIHMEEFTNDILIEGNRFVHITPSRGFYIDRERQNASNIRIINNKFEGSIGWIISSYSPDGLVFEGNDFSEATIAQSASYQTFDFSYYQDEHEREFFPYEVATKNLVFRNNPGLSGASMRLYVEEGDNSNQIDYAAAVKTTVPKPTPQFVEGSKYFIKSVSGRYLSISNTGAVVSSSSLADAQTFIFEFDGLQNYALRAENGLYLECFDIFTLSDIRDNNASGHQYFATLERDYAGLRKPIFYFEKRSDEPLQYAVYPGGNERKSRLIERGEGATLEVEMVRYMDESDNSIDIPLGDSSLWTLEQVQ